MEYVIKHFKIPYTVEGLGEDAILNLLEIKKEEVRTETKTSNENDILKLSTAIAAHNDKEKETAKAIGGTGYITIQILSGS